MKYVLFVALFFSSIANAGLFCGEFECDLSVSEFQVKTEPFVEILEHKITNVYKGQYNEVYQSYLKEIQAKYDEREKNEELKNCKITSSYDTKYDLGLAVKGINKLVEVNVTTRTNCIKIISKTAKSKNQIEKELCQKALACSSEIKNRENLNEYINLKNKMCDGITLDAKSSITSNIEINSSSRSSTKTTLIESSIDEAKGASRNFFGLLTSRLIS